jgi:membrane-associated phospholipid phosphatase
MVFEKKTYTNQKSQTEISNHLANFISIFVAPPTIAIVATVSFSLWSPIGLGLLSAPFSILLCFFCFAFVPFLSILYFYRKNIVDLYVSKRKARTPFFLIAIASYSFAAIIFLFTNTKIMFLLALGYILVSIILMVVNLFWKVSVHCAGVTGPIFSLIFVFGINAIPLSLIVGLVGWSRIKLKNHTFTQTLVGTLIALIVGLVEYSILYI